MPTLLEAIRHKYGPSAAGESAEDLGAPDDASSSAPSSLSAAADKEAEDGGSEADEAPGAAAQGDKEAHLPVAIFVPRRPPRRCVPALLVLNDCDIESAGDARDLRAACRAVEELDLAQNKLGRWREVMGILQQAPRVKFLNLSFNWLQEPLSAPTPTPLPPLRHLVLNGTRVTWESLNLLLALLPGLEELHLSLNEMREVWLAAEHPTLRRLYFNSNPISDWGQVVRLGAAFSALESLSLADCPLRSLQPDSVSPSASDDASREYSRSESGSESANAVAEEDPSSCSPHHTFRHLRCLNVSGTLLGSWDEVDRLSRFPALTSLRIHGCPLFEFPQEYTEHERRQLLIARLPNIRTLNGGGLVTADEREDSERAFIRYYMDKPESDRPERYTDLVAVHGRLDPLVQIDLSPEKRVKVRVSYGPHSEVRSLHVYQTVGDLKQKLEAFTGMPAARMRLFYVDQAMKSIHGAEEMRFPAKRLYSYNIASGDEIIVDSKQRGSPPSHNNNNNNGSTANNNPR